MIILYHILIFKTKLDWRLKNYQDYVKCLLNKKSEQYSDTIDIYEFNFSVSTNVIKSNPFERIMLNWSQLKIKSII